MKFFWLKLFLILMLGVLSLSLFLLISFSEGHNNQSLGFIDYFKWTLLWGFVSSVLLFLMVFLYLKPSLHFAQFLFHLFGPRGLVRKTRQSDWFSCAPVLREIERKKALAYLSKTRNVYLKNIRQGLISVLQKNPERDQKAKSYPSLSFSDIVHKVICQSKAQYPRLRISSELNADIELPVLADKLFQALWELIKNGAEAFPQVSKGIGSLKTQQIEQENSEPKNLKAPNISIRTFKKKNKWFCCELKDNGPGMNRATMEKAGRLYFTTKKESTGLGLPFTESVLSRIGGIMKLQSAKQGLKVSLFIPLDYIAHIQFLNHSHSENFKCSSDKLALSSRAGEFSLANEKAQATVL